MKRRKLNLILIMMAAWLALLALSFFSRGLDTLVLLLAHAFAAVAGVMLIWVAVASRERQQRLFDAVFNSPVPTCVTGKNFVILVANEAYWRKFGKPAAGRALRCYEHRPGRSCGTESCPLVRLMGGAEKYAYECIKDHDKEAHNFIITATPLLDSRGKMAGIVESFQEITERARAEAELARSNRMLESLSNTDGLTGIANRRCFDEALAQEYARHARSGARLSLIMLDLDYFKAFNDRYGHVRGDECLQEVARVMKECANRPADRVARYGGEEFVCILPETGSSGALAIAEKIRLGIMARGIHHADSPVAPQVTASLGVVTDRCLSGGSPLDFVVRADELLYRAKVNGRNRVEFSVSHEIDGESKGRFVHLFWHDSFCSGNELIDTQHRLLFEQANRLLEAVLRPAAPGELHALVHNLLAEVRQHFNDEEGILGKTGFSGLGLHAGEHGRLLEKGEAFAVRLKEGELTPGEVFQFLAYDLVLMHLLKADREYFPSLSQVSSSS